MSPPNGEHTFVTHSRMDLLVQLTFTRVNFRFETAQYVGNLEVEKQIRRHLKDLLPEHKGTIRHLLESAQNYTRPARSPFEIHRDRDPFKDTITFILKIDVGYQEGVRFETKIIGIQHPHPSYFERFQSLNEHLPTMHVLP